MDALRKDARYTYADYASWTNDVRCELIDGVVYMMSPSPSRKHQDILLEIAGQLRENLKGKTCKVYVAPFDVRLNSDGRDDTVVQPDILVVCDKKKLDDRGCKGAPDMIVEIISPSTESHDRVVKFNKYLQSGVREYWIVDPESKTLSVYILEDGKYIASAYTREQVRVHVLEDCVINLTDVYAAEN